jgi:hypothetical protein
VFSSFPKISPLQILLGKINWQQTCQPLKVRNLLFGRKKNAQVQIVETSATEVPEARKGAHRWLKLETSEHPCRFFVDREAIFFVRMVACLLPTLFVEL